MFKSEAQRRKFKEFVKSGTMSQAVYDEWDKKTKGKLPERLKTQTSSKSVRLTEKQLWDKRVREFKKGMK